MAAHVERSTWICPTPADRARVLDMQQRFKPVRALSFAFMVAALGASTPWLGLWPLPRRGAAQRPLGVIDPRLPRAPPPATHD